MITYNDIVNAVKSNKDSLKLDGRLKLIEAEKYCPFCGRVYKVEDEYIDGKLSSISICRCFYDDIIKRMEENAKYKITSTDIVKANKKGVRND